MDNDQGKDEIAGLIAMASDRKRSGPVRRMAKILAEQIEIQRECPENKALPKVIAATVEMLRERIEAERKLEAR